MIRFKDVNTTCPIGASAASILPLYRYRVEQNNLSTPTSMGKCNWLLEGILSRESLANV